MNVGIRELKAHLSRYVARVRERVVVTDRGRAVARLEPVSSGEVPAALRDLVAAGRVIYGRAGMERPGRSSCSRVNVIRRTASAISGR